MTNNRRPGFAIAVRSIIGACVLLLVASRAYAAVPTAPTNLAATAISSTQINLAWTDASNNETSFKIERKTGANGTYSQIATTGTNVATFNDTGLAAATTYFYRVRASNSSGNSAYTNVASAATSGPDATAPSAPTRLTANVVSPSQVNLSWNASTDNIAVAAYQVFRATRQAIGPPSQPIQIASVTGTTFSDTGIAPKTGYLYQVFAVDAAGNVSSPSNSVAAPQDTTPPTAPSGVMATVVSATQINLGWTAATDNWAVQSYMVDRCFVVNGLNECQEVGSPTGTSFSDTGLTAATTYSYLVYAVDTSGNVSDPSSSVSATTQVSDTTPPTAPTGLTASAVSATQVNLGWAASTDDVGVTGYLVERCQGAGCTTFSQIATPTATTLSDTGLTAATNYSYRVRATDAAGNLSSYSNIASTVTAGAQVQMYYIVPDQLNTPRMVEDQNANVVWRWDQGEPFGATQPNADADGDGIAFDFPLRFPGQYFDKETSLTHNFSRSYDSATGRYAQSDLVGLWGGVNTYAYALENPLVLVDPYGLLGVGLVGSGSLEGGVGVGVGATATDGIGVFVSGSGAGIGGFASIGATPVNSSDTQGVLGLFGGVGGGFFLTNAGSASDLIGPFHTISFNLGGGAGISIQVSWDGSGTVITSGTIGPGLGVAVSTYPTTTTNTFDLRIPGGGSTSSYPLTPPPSPGPSFPAPGSPSPSPGSSFPSPGSSSPSPGSSSSSSSSSSASCQ